MYFLPLITTTIFFYIIQITYQEKLIFAMTHFRHGARAPNDIDDYTGLDNVHEKWSAPGHLTAVGMRMQYLMGLRNRKRYIEDYKLLSPKFDPHEILIYSTNYNRTLMSAYSHLLGFYPNKKEIGLSLTEKQEILAVPQIDINDSYIQNEIENLNLSALPNFMTVIPIRMINDLDVKANLYSSKSCVLANYEVTKNASMESIVAITYVFNEKYKNYLNEFFGDSSTYDFSSLKTFCDAFVASYTDRRNITELKNTGINFEELIENCYELQKLKFRDYVLNSGKNKFDRLESSKLLREMIRLIKQRVDIDINNITEIEYDDFSKPKMMIISAHDTTISCHEMAIINCFNLNLEDYFRFPKFTAQMAIEVTRKDDNEINDVKLSYKDYTVNYYFNDEKQLSTSLDNFIEKMENYLWTDEEVDNFCSGKNSSDTDNDNSDDNINNKNNYVLIFGIAICVLCVLIIIFLTGNIVLIVLYKKAKKGGSDKSISLIGVSKSKNKV